MKLFKFIATGLLMLFSTHASAACPKTISGIYSGYIVETRSDGSTAIFLARVVITAQGTGTTTLLGGARTGPNGYATTPSTFSFTSTATFSSTTCSGITTATSGPEIGNKSLYTVSNNGNTMHIVIGVEETDGSGVSASLGVLTKQ
jgi:hypothetical protein